MSKQSIHHFHFRGDENDPAAFRRYAREVGREIRRQQTGTITQPVLITIHIDPYLRWFDRGVRIGRWLGRMFHA